MKVRSIHVLSHSLRLKPDVRGNFLERHDGYGTYWGVPLSEEETAALFGALLTETKDRECTDIEVD